MEDPQLTRSLNWHNLLAFKAYRVMVHGCSLELPSRTSRHFNEEPHESALTTRREVNGFNRE